MVSSHQSDQVVDYCESENSGKSVYCNIICMFQKITNNMFPPGPYSALRQSRRRPPTTFRWLLYRTLASISKYHTPLIPLLNKSEYYCVLLFCYTYYTLHHVTLLCRATYTMAHTNWLCCNSHWCLLHTALQGDKTPGTTIPCEHTISRAIASGEELQHSAGGK